MLGPNLTLYLNTSTWFYITQNNFEVLFSCNYSVFSVPGLLGFSMKAGYCLD